MDTTEISGSHLMRTIAKWHRLITSMNLSTIQTRLQHIQQAWFHIESQMFTEWHFKMLKGLYAITPCIAEAHSLRLFQTNFLWNSAKSLISKQINEKNPNPSTGVSYLHYTFGVIKKYVSMFVLNLNSQRIFLPFLAKQMFWLRTVRNLYIMKRKWARGW